MHAKGAQLVTHDLPDQLREPGKVLSSVGIVQVAKAALCGLAHTSKQCRIAL